MLSPEQIDCAVKWWVNALKGPKVDLFGSSEARHAPENKSAAMAEVMLIGLQMDNRPTEEQLVIFETELRNQLERAEWIHTLDVDYGPGRYLSEAGKAAKFGSFVFPIKTIMWFSNGGVQVAEGYGAASKEILKK